MKPEKPPETNPDGKPKKPPLRMSRPPYTVYLWDGPEPVFTLPGTMLKALGHGLAPTANEVRAMLLKLRNEFRWSRETMGAVLGVSRDVIRRWENSCCASR